MSAPVIQKIAPPALPQCSEQFDRAYQDQLNNVQRLFYNRLTQSYNSLISPSFEGVLPGGSYLYFPYAAVQRDTDVSFTANIPTQITFNITDFISAMVSDGTDGVKAGQAGVYNYQFSVQLKNTDTQTHSAWIWLRINGVDVPGTGSKFDVVSSHGGIPGYVIAACNFYVQMQPDDTVEMWAAVSNTAVSFDASPAATTPFIMPSIPSIVATVAFVSAV
jgi:hypothetical protein